jgi:type VI secretion system secreted protein VgrG
VRENVLEPDFDGGKFALAAGVAGTMGNMEAPAPATPRAGAGTPQGFASPLDDPAVQAIVDKSPTLKGDLAELKAQKWEVVYGPAGGGSQIERKQKVITIDGNQRNDPAAAVQSISHEVGHAEYPYVKDTSSREAYVAAGLADEGAATLKNIQVQREIIANGGPNIGLAGNSKNHEAYNAAYDQYLQDGNAAKAHKAIGSIYGEGEIGSVTGLPYGTKLGNHYDKVYGQN